MVDYQDHRVIILVFVVVFFVIACLFVGLNLFSALFIVKTLRPPEYLMIVAWVGRFLSFL